MPPIPYRKRAGKIFASAMLVALLGSAAVPLLSTVAENEGYVPVGYLDPVGIPTKCFGETRNVIVGHEYTWEQCLEGLNVHALEIAQYAMRCVPQLSAMHDKVKVAAVDMAYNIGPTAFCNSSVANYFRKGEWERGCKRMAEIYKTAKGKELLGLVKRRQQNSQMCLDGLKEMH